MPNQAKKAKKPAKKQKKLAIIPGGSDAECREALAARLPEVQTLLTRVPKNDFREVHGLALAALVRFSSNPASFFL